MTVRNFNVFVGGSTGSVKGVTVGQDICGIRSVFHNLIKTKAELSNKNEVTCMEWCNDNSELLVSFKDKLKLLNVSQSDFVFESNSADGDIRGMFKESNKCFVALSSGIIKTTEVDNPNGSWTEYMKMNGKLERVKRSILKNDIIATGGEDNDLKLWNVETKEITFNAKNIKPDELQIQAPIWISDIAFSHLNEKVSTCSRHGYVRCYDPRLPQRRPIFNAHQSESVFTCLSTTPNDEQLLVGNGAGEIYLVDIRGKTPFLSKFKGCCGAVKGISCPSDSNLVFSVSLDRYFRIHDFKTRKLLFKDYMVSRLTAVTTKTPFIIEKFEDKVKSEERDETILTKTSKSNEKALDQLFKNMETVVDKEISDNKLTTPRKITIKQEKKKKKRDKRDGKQVSDVDVDSSSESDSDNSEDKELVPPKKIKWKKVS